MRNKVKKIRHEQNITQEELAKKANVSRTILSHIETEKDINVGFNTLRKIADALGYSINEIFLQ